VTQAAADALKLQTSLAKLLVQAQMQTAGEGADAQHQFGVIRREQFGGGRGRGRTDIGGKIAQGDIGFMTDRANYRQWASGHRADYRLFIKRPQILQRAAATRQNQRVKAATGGKPIVCDSREAATPPAPQRAISSAMTMW